VRERAGRESLVVHIERAAELARADTGWQVLDERLVWDLSGPEGSYAKATAEKELLFTQDEVFSIYEYQFKSPGVVLSHVCEGGARGQAMVALPILQKDFPGPEGRVYRLISLQRIWHRGEIMAFRSERELEGHFCEQTEDVMKEVSVETAPCFDAHRVAVGQQAQSPLAGAQQCAARKHPVGTPQAREWQMELR
jgi:hypothetical protein